MRTVYLQTHEDGTPLNVNAYTAWEGFKALGFEVRTFQLEQLPDLELTPDTLVHGHIGTVWRALEQIGMTTPPYLLTPPPLLPFLGRDQWETVLGEVRRLEGVPVFIKP